jgi:hypothetical protein
MYVKVEDKEGNNCSNIYVFVIRDFATNENLSPTDGIYSVDINNLTLLLLAKDHAPIAGTNGRCAVYPPPNFFFYVVKGGFGGLTYTGLNHFHFSTIGNQVHGVPFQITIEARDASDNLLTGFNGICVFLSSFCDWAFPNSDRLFEPPFLEFSGGKWTGQCLVRFPTSYITAQIRAGDCLSESNSFVVT